MWPHTDLQLWPHNLLYFFQNIHVDHVKCELAEEEKAKV